MRRHSRPRFARLAAGARLAPIAGAALLGYAARGEAAPHFVDATSSSGLDWTQLTWGAQAVDVDRDGDPDLFSGHHFSSAYLHTNDGTGVFTVWGLPQFINTPGDRHGMLFADLNGDGFPEAYSTHGGEGGCALCPSDPSELWRGLGGGLFALVPGAGGLADSLGRGRSISAADVDGDGDLDLHVTKAPQVLSPNSLFRNDGGLSFVDVAGEWGLNEVLGSVGSIFGDLDDDGDPDLLVGGEEFSRPTRYFRNEGGHFVDATAATFGSLPVVAGADFGDFDGDLDLDLVICEGSDAVHDAWRAEGNELLVFGNHRFADDGVDAFTFRTSAPNPWAHFRHNGIVDNATIFLGPSGIHPTGGTVTLSDAFAGAPAFTPGSDLGLYCWRESPGGAWQIRISAPPGTYGNFSGLILDQAPITDIGDAQLERPALSPGRTLVYRNDGGAFANVTASLGITASTNPRSVAWVDIDDDGDLDLHLVNKGTVEMGNELDRIWRNDGAAFALLAGEAQGNTEHMGDGGTWADFDRDGDVDLFLQEGAGPHFLSLGAPARYYRNDGADGHWLRATLTAAAGATAVGAKVTAYAGGLAVQRRVQANSWRAFQLPEELHFGLGAFATADSVVVEWPSGSVDRYLDFAADRGVSFEENASPVGVLPEAPADRSFVGEVYPQPGRAVQRLRLVAPRSGPGRIGVYDVAGRRVRSLAGGEMAAGELELAWDGRDENGRPVPAGIYFWRGAGVLEFERRSVRIR